MLPNSSVRNRDTNPVTDQTCTEDAIVSQVTTANPRLTFIDNQQCVRRLSADAAAKHRHAIFTETERQHMSDQVIQSVPDQDPAQALLDLERVDPNGNITEPFSFFRGPFGVSKLSQCGTEPISQHETEPINQCEPEPSSQDVDEALLSAEDWLAGFDETAEQVPNELYLFSSLLDVPDGPSNIDPEILDLIPSGKTPLYPPDLQALISPNYFTDNAEAWSILSHYKDQMAPLISPFGQSQETSWMNLVMPCAVHTLGELTMGSSATHARLALLNALLSTSAFHIGNNSTPFIEHWMPISNDYLQRAQHHFIRCLEEAYVSTMKKSKYKEILMAILSLSTAYMVKGDSGNRLLCLIEAEKFICSKGFKQTTLSLKRRTLHHCYAYMRIMAETTSIANGLNMDAASSSILDEGPIDTEFRICPDITFSENILDMEKDPNVAQRDIHLAIPGRWSMTLFPKMYGVAEGFLMLLSQVVRLANERDRSILCTRSEDMLNLKDFWIRAKALEKGIHLLLDHIPTTSENANQTDITKPRAQAMYTALLIFFHRRVYDLDAAILRHEVDTVRNALIRVQQDEDAHGNGNGNPAALIWPAFIAACEAVSSEAQTFFSSWFDVCFTATRLVNASAAKQIFEMIWKKREAGKYKEMCSWPEVLRAMNIRLICT